MALRVWFRRATEELEGTSAEDSIAERGKYLRQGWRPSAIVVVVVAVKYHRRLTKPSRSTRQR